MMRQGRVGPSGNVRAQEQLRAAEKLSVSQREADLKSALSTSAGRRLLWDIIDRRCAAHGTGYSASGSEMYFNCGMRSVGIDLREDLKRVDAGNYALLLQEALVASSEQQILVQSAESKAKTEMDDEEDS